MFFEEAIRSEDIFKTTCDSMAADWSIFNTLRLQYKVFSNLKKLLLIVTKSSMGISKLASLKLNRQKIPDFKCCKDLTATPKQSGCKRNFDFFKTVIKTNHGDSELHWNSKRISVVQ